MSVNRPAHQKALTYQRPASSGVGPDALSGLAPEACTLPGDDEQHGVFHDVTHAVGIVPTVALHRVSRICQDHACFLKLESCNPGGSIKEKNAVYLVDRAEEEGELRPGGVIVESSSGNFGIGLAMVGAARGYRVIIVVDAKTQPPMRRMLKAYGAELVDVPASEADQNGSMQRARMRKALHLFETVPGAWYPCQHLNSQNPDAHYFYTAQEIAASFGGSLDAVVVGVSTAGQIMGILIRQGRSRQVALASMCRLAWVCAALSAGVTLRVDGAVLAGLTLIGSVLVEAIMVTAVAGLEPRRSTGGEDRGRGSEAANHTRRRVALLCPARSDDDPRLGWACGADERGRSRIRWPSRARGLARGVGPRAVDRQRDADGAAGCDLLDR